MKMEELQKLDDEKKSLIWYAGDLRDAIGLLERMDIGSKEKIISLLDNEALMIIKRAEFLQEEIIKGMKERKEPSRSGSGN